jgi:outer membrane protein OmpA-like peptidoglycan-associated protein
MTHRSFRFRFRSARPTLLAALVLTLLPLATAAAQELPRVRVNRGDTTIRAMRSSNNDVWKLMRADAGMVFDVLDVEGEQGRFLESNWYLVVLPRDAYGTQWVGWISGRHVEPGPPREPVVTAARPLETVSAAVPRPVERVAAAAATPPPAVAAITPRTLPDVVLRFAFDRSDLSETAKNTLATALTTMGAEAGSLSFALGGHADAMGPDDYNQKLGLARADAVRKYIAEQLKIPAERISVSSHGEAVPVASNDTRAGRAENRRVVVTVTATGPVPVAAR